MLVHADSFHVTDKNIVGNFGCRVYAIDSPLADYIKGVAYDPRIRVACVLDIVEGIADFYITFLLIDSYSACAGAFHEHAKYGIAVKKVSPDNKCGITVNRMHTGDPQP